jgi:hypothetical protein
MKHPKSQAQRQRRDLIQSTRPNFERRERKQRQARCVVR